MHLPHQVITQHNGGQLNPIYPNQSDAFFVLIAKRAVMPVLLHLFILWFIEENIQIKRYICGHHQRCTFDHHTNNAFSVILESRRVAE